MYVSACTFVQLAVMLVAISHYDCLMLLGLVEMRIRFWGLFGSAMHS